MNIEELQEQINNLTKENEELKSEKETLAKNCEDLKVEHEKTTNYLN